MTHGTDWVQRSARMADARQIAEIINDHASQGRMLSRSLSQVYEGLREYEVAEADGQIVGCGALNITWEDLCEIRSVAVREHWQNRGVGTRIVEALLDQARQLGVKRVFLLTYKPGFFKRFGFCETEKDGLPHKVWSDCVNCVKFPDCDEVAMIIEL